MPRRLQRSKNYLETDYTKNHIKSYVLRGGRFSTKQKTAYKNGLGSLILLRPQQPMCFPELFGNENKVIIEIGFGSGEATAAIAQKNPNNNYIGIEVYKSGIGNLCSLVTEKDIENVRIIEGDAYEIIRDTVPEMSVWGFHFFFPDPWPKKKHHKRRLIRTDFTPILVKALMSGGYIYFITDWEDYAARAKFLFDATEGLSNKYNGYAPPQSWRPETRFQRKGREQNHPLFELYYMKK